MSTTVIPTTLTTLAARLTDPRDRETYAGLVSYFNSIPRHDELFRLVELLGLLSLLGQRVPDAIGDLLAELRADTRVAADYRAQLDLRLTQLPQEITSGINLDALGRAMSERLRQQLLNTGLQEIATVMTTSARQVILLEEQITTTLKPALEQHHRMTSRIAADLENLRSASEQLREHNARLIRRERSHLWIWLGLLAFCLCLVGGVGGIAFEKRQTTDLLSHLQAELESGQPEVDQSKSPLVRKGNPQTPEALSGSGSKPHISTGHLPHSTDRSRLETDKPAHP